MDATNVASVAATARTSGQSICMVPPRFVTGSLRRQVDELFRFLAEEPDRRGRRLRRLAAPLIPPCQHGSAPLLDRLAGRREPQRGEPFRDALIEQRLRRSRLAAHLVLDADQTLHGQQPDPHRIEARPPGPSQHLRPARGVRAELVALAEHGEHPAQPRVRLQPGVRWTRRRGWRTRPEERAQHPAEHGYPGTPQAFQIRSAYSLMLRSEENFPMCAMLRMAIRVQRSGSRNVLPTRSWHSAYDWKSASSMYVSCSSSE